MDINKRNRTELKSYFVKNAIPTESNFADLVEGALNQKDDGIVKLPGNPLSIEAAGDATSLKKAVSLYRNFSDANPDWTINLNPRSDPNDANTARSGFNISDGEGNNRLFIDRTTGNVGVGTTSPGESKLKVVGSATDFTHVRFSGQNMGELEFVGWSSGWNINTKTAGKHLYLNRDAGETSDVVIGRIGQELAVKGKDGNVGVGMTSPGAKLDVAGVGDTEKQVSLQLRSGNSSNNFNSSQITFGYSNTAQYRHVIKTRHHSGQQATNAIDFYVWKQGTDAPDTIGTLHVMTLDGGNVGIGTTGPNAKLQVDNPNAAASQALILSNSNTGFAADEGVYQSYYVGATTGNEMARIQAANKTAGVGSAGYLAFYTRDADKVTEKVRVDNTGNVGIGVPAPRTALDTGLGVMSGAANDYQKAQFTLSGGGTVSWGGPNSYLKWSSRFIAISMERTKTFASGYVDVALPSDASLVTAWDKSTRLDPAQGILLKDWEALYAVHEIGRGNDKVTFQIVIYNSGAFHAPSNWLLVAVVNSDDKTIKLGTGATVSASSTYASLYGSSLPKGAIIMWSGDAAPAGWAFCNGQNGTPDLQGRFILAAGNGSGLTARKRGDTGGEEKHQLSLNEMPSHNHAISDPGHFHNWTGSRQEAGVDDHNNTQEFSKGDAGKADTVSKNTDSKTTGISINAAGGNGAHENMPPFYVLAYIIKL